MFEFNIKALAEADDVTALFHRHRDADRRFAIEAQAGRGRVFVTAIDLGNIADAEGAPGKLNGQIAHVLDTVQAAADAHEYFVGGGVE